METFLFIVISVAFLFIIYGLATFYDFIDPILNDFCYNFTKDRFSAYYLTEFIYFSPFLVLLVVFLIRFILRKSKMRKINTLKDKISTYYTKYKYSLSEVKQHQRLAISLEKIYYGEEIAISKKLKANIKNIIETEKKAKSNIKEIQKILFHEENNSKTNDENTLLNLLTKLAYLESKEEELKSLSFQIEDYKKSLKNEYHTSIPNDNSKYIEEFKQLRKAFVSLKKCKAIYNQSGITLSICTDNKSPQLLNFVDSEYSPLTLSFPDMIVCIYPECALFFDNHFAFVGAYSINCIDINIKTQQEKVMFSWGYDANGYCSKYIAEDSKCIEKDKSYSTTYKYRRIDGKPDQRYKFNPVNYHRHDIMEYGILIISIGSFEYEFFISSQYSIDLFKHYINQKGI